MGDMRDSLWWLSPGDCRDILMRQPTISHEASRGANRALLCWFGASTAVSKKRKRLLLVAGLFVGLAIVGTVALYPWSEVPNHINQDAYEKIAKGMTREDVVKLLGVSPGNYVTKNLRFVPPV